MEWCLLQGKSLERRLLWQGKWYMFSLAPFDGDTGGFGLLVGLERKSEA